MPIRIAFEHITWFLLIFINHAGPVNLLVTFPRKRQELPAAAQEMMKNLLKGFTSASSGNPPFHYTPQKVFRRREKFNEMIARLIFLSSRLLPFSLCQFINTEL